MLNLTRIAQAAATECIRQEVGIEALAHLLEAYATAYAVATGIPDPTADRLTQVAAKFHTMNMIRNKGLPTEFDVEMMALHAVPDTHGNYRRTPVFFADGSQAPHHDTVSTAIKNLFARLSPHTPTDPFIKEFLQIHPFVDGNGRVAWILLNWLNHTLPDPTPLPDYFRPK